MGWMQAVSAQVELAGDVVLEAPPDLAGLSSAAGITGSSWARYRKRGIDKPSLWDPLVMNSPMSDNKPVVGADRLDSEVECAIVRSACARVEQTC
jgi:hypothetical protein